MERADAPYCRNSLAIVVGSKSCRIIPFEGDAFLISAIKFKPGFFRCL